MKKDNMLNEIKRHMSVLMEEMRSQVKLIAEQYGSFVDRFDVIDDRFDVIDERFNRIEAKLGEHDRRFDRVDLDLKAIKNAVFDNSHRLSDHDTRIRKLEMS